MMSSALLIFDLDGTLYRTASSFLPTMRRVFESFGAAAPADEEIMAHVGEPFSVFLDWASGRGLDAERDTLARIIADAEYDSIRACGELFPGVLETLRALRDLGHVLAICTNGDRHYTGVILEKYRIGDLFNAIRTYEDEKKPKTRMTAELRARWPDRSAFVIGDRIHDVEAGQANGCTVIGAKYGYGQPAELESADHRIESFPELLRILVEAS